MIYIKNSRKLNLKKHPELVISNADKGNITVIMNKNKYKNKILELLNDTNTYKIINTDPTQAIQNLNNNLIDDWLKREIIKKNLAIELKCTNGLALKFYGLLKIHKSDCPMRPVTSFKRLSHL